MRHSGLPRNDLRQYDELVEQWWDPFGALAMLHWLAAARARLVPPASRYGAVLLDIGCGGGVMAPHLQGKGYRHVGVDVNSAALGKASQHGVSVVRADVHELPVADATCDVVCAGEVFEHVADAGRVMAECCRVLKPGGSVVLDTIASTALARLLAITVAERIKGGAPAGLHDPELLVDRRKLMDGFAAGGVQLQTRGIRPSLRHALGWRRGSRAHVDMVPTFTTAVLFQAWGRKQA